MAQVVRKDVVAAQLTTTGWQKVPNSKIKIGNPATDREVLRTMDQLQLI